MVRSNPKRYAELYIQPNLQNYSGNKYTVAQECIAELSGAAENCTYGYLSPIFSNIFFATHTGHNVYYRYII